MRRPDMIGQARRFGLGALAACSLMLAQGRDALAQPPSNSGDAPVVPRSSAIQGRDLGARAVDRDARMLIAHGLEMAIEGSTLQAMYLQSSGMVGALRVDPRPPLTGVVGSSSASVPVVRPGSAIEVAPAVTTPAVGVTGRPGETVSGRVVGDGNSPPPPATGSPVVTSPVPGPVPGVVIPEAPITNAQAPELLRQHALRAFEAGDRLIDGMAAPGGQDERLQNAAKRYALILKSIAPPAAVRVAVAPGSAASVAVAATPAPAVPVIGFADLASIALINHEVREALGAMRIRQYVHLTGGIDGPAAQQLIAHAERMEKASRAAIQNFASGAAAPVSASGAAIPNGPVQSLAQQANELINALQSAPPTPADAANSVNPAR